jgi:hypothetical protein
VITFNDIMSVANVLKEAGKIEQYKQILEFQQQLQETQNENLELQRKVEKLKEQLLLKGKVEYNDPFYWLRGEDRKDGPFCCGCWDLKKELIRVPGYEQGRYQIDCPVCHTRYNNPLYENSIPM